MKREARERVCAAERTQLVREPPGTLRGLLGNLTVGGRVVELSPVEISLFDAIAKRLFWKLLELSDPEVSAELGFSAQSNFTRFFQQQVGIPPSEYRRAAFRPPEDQD